MQLNSAAYTMGGAIPVRYTCEGDDISPEFSWIDAPPETKSFALILHDPDAPKPGGFTHWTIYNIPAEVGHIEEKVPKEETVPGTGMQGKNDSGDIGYMGPCPPSGTHRYFARLFALSRKLPLPPGASPAEVNAAMKDIVLVCAELMGTYAKKAEKAA